MKPFRWLRVRFKTWAARHWLVIEFCHECGRKQPLVWWSDDALWAELAGNTGILCPECFTHRASRKYLLRWRPVVEHEFMKLVRRDPKPDASKVWEKFLSK